MEAEHTSGQLQVLPRRRWRDPLDLSFLQDARSARAVDRTGRRVRLHDSQALRIVGSGDLSMLHVERSVGSLALPKLQLQRTRHSLTVLHLRLVGARGAPRTQELQTMRYKRSELRQFALAMRNVRDALGVDQVTMAHRLETSPRTLSDWENSYAMPKANQRVQFLYAVHAMAPDWTETFAALLGIATHPALGPILDDEGEDDAPTVAVASPPQPPSPPPRPTREDIRAALDHAVREAADLADLRASDVRKSAHAVLAAVADAGCTIDEAMAALAGPARPQAKKPRAPTGSAERA